MLNLLLIILLKLLGIMIKRLVNQVKLFTYNVTELD